MIINPNLKKENLCFYNNLMLIVTVFCVIFFWSYFSAEYQVIAKKFYTLNEGSTYGPIVVKKGQTKICRIETDLHGNNLSLYFSGEVLDKDKETLYEFGKELWHEEGYDAEGYWSESERHMAANLTFSEPGTYYIRFHTDENLMHNIGMTIKVKKGSGIPYLMIGTYLFIIVLIFFILLNRAWLFEEFENLNDLLEEMSDD